MVVVVDLADRSHFFVRAAVGLIISGAVGLAIGGAILIGTNIAIGSSGLSLW